MGSVNKNNQRKELGRIIIDPNQMRIFKDGASLELSIREYDIVNFLASEPGRVFSRDELLYHVWNYTGYQGDMLLCAGFEKKSRMIRPIQRLL